jgi:hypothetical protein
MQTTIKRTVASPRQYAKAFIKAWLALGYDVAPTQTQVGVIYAQWMVETGGAACWCWNIGNVKVTQGQVDAGVPWFDLPGTWEIIGGKKVTLQPGDPGRRFRAFGSLDEAMGEHLAFLRNKRYRSSWPAVESGDPDAFARALKAQGYYTAHVDVYARAMRDHHAIWMRSKAYDDALAEVLDEDEKDTIPEGLTPGSYRAEAEPRIVYAMPETVLYDLTRDPDSEPPPPDEAA